jgi:hypothetical protein
MEKAKASVYSPFTIYHSREKPRAANNAGPFFKPFKIAVERLAELFSGLFYVAASRLNSPRFDLPIETLLANSVKIRSPATHDVWSPSSVATLHFLFTIYE